MSNKCKYNYSRLKHTWGSSLQENFFVSYAVRGPMVDPENGLRAGMPVNHPLCNSPVIEPSILNTRWMYSPPIPKSGIF